VPDIGHQIKGVAFGSEAFKSSTFGTNPSSSTMSNDNFYKFPWFSHINASKLEDFIPGDFKSEDTGLTAVSSEASVPTSVFALANILGSIKISSELITSVTNTSVTAVGCKLSELDELSNYATQTGSETLQPELLVFEATQTLRVRERSSQLAKYFETHYKYTYSIRTSNSFAISYLRLPQSSIQKNE